MTLKIPNVGELLLLKQLRDRLNVISFIRLYKNAYTPIDTSGVSDFEECDFTGYAQQQMTAWSDAVLTAAGRAQIEETARIFSLTGIGSQDVYGYYVVDNDGALLWAERDDDGPRTVDTTHPDIAVVPRFTFASEF